MGHTQKSDRTPWIKLFLFIMLGLAIGILLTIAFTQERHRPWKKYQKAYNQARADRLANSLKGRLNQSEIEVMQEEIRQSPLRIKEIRPSLTGKKERCLTCHDGLEEISPSHPVEAFGCIVCHGGNGRGVTVETAHQGLIGGRNPSNLAVVDQTCGQPGGQCHSERKLWCQNSVDRVKTSIMATMSGVISSLRYAWTAQPDIRSRYASVKAGSFRTPVKTDDPETLGTIPLMNPIPGIKPTDPLGLPLTFSGQAADDQWRKFCARCHLWNKRESGPSAHSSGCAACHMLYNSGAAYHGLDPTIPKNQPGYAALHRFNTAIPTDQCLRCHNRSGRIGLTFKGFQEADGYGTPYGAGKPNTGMLSGGRDVRRLLPDVHFEKGMACVDCHTPSEIMGNGRLYSHMRDQTEIRCVTCHGSPDKLPRTKIIGDDDDEALWRAKTLGMKDMIGRETAVTEHGTFLLNLRREKGRLLLKGKLDHKDHDCPVITGDKIHRIPGHGPERMECSACHARWAPQCYGCHDYRLQGTKMTDSMLGRRTEGGWQETRDYYRFAKPSLGINARGKISIMVPGCQVIYTELDTNNRPLPGSYKKVFKGPGLGHGIISTPLSPHSIRAEVRPCRDCHADPKTLGIGQGFFYAGDIWEENTFTPLLNPDINPLGFAWESMVDAQGRPLAATTHTGARPLNAEELKRLLRVAPCLPCHDRYDDPIWTDPAKAFKSAKLPGHRRKVALALENPE